MRYGEDVHIPGSFATITVSIPPWTLRHAHWAETLILRGRSVLGGVLLVFWYNWWAGLYLDIDMWKQHSHPASRWSLWKGACSWYDPDLIIWYPWPDRPELLMGEYGWQCASDLQRHWYNKDGSSVFWAHLGCIWRAEVFRLLKAFVHDVLYWIRSDRGFVWRCSWCWVYYSWLLCSHWLLPVATGSYSYPRLRRGQVQALRAWRQWFAMFSIKLQFLAG